MSVPVTRRAGDVSPKVVAPTLALALATVVSAVASGDFSSSEFALACSTVIVAVLGYVKKDKA